MKRQNHGNSSQNQKVNFKFMGIKSFQKWPLNCFWGNYCYFPSGTFAAPLTAIVIINHHQSLHQDHHRHNHLLHDPCHIDHDANGQLYKST